MLLLILCLQSIYTPAVLPADTRTHTFSFFVNQKPIELCADRQINVWTEGQSPPSTGPRCTQGPTWTPGFHANPPDLEMGFKAFRAVFFFQGCLGRDWGKTKTHNSDHIHSYTKGGSIRAGPWCETEHFLSNCREINQTSETTARTINNTSAVTRNIEILGAILRCVKLE